MGKIYIPTKLDQKHKICPKCFLNNVYEKSNELFYVYEKHKYARNVFV